MMLKAGITGGIGSGKTLVCSVFSHLGVPVFYADAEGKIILQGEAREEVLQFFGKDVLDPSGNIDRKKLGSIVFSDEAALYKLNKIIHPKVFAAFKAWVEKQDAPYVLKEAAILFESGADKGVDFTITVEAPEPLRIKRVMERDKVEAGMVKERMSRQWTEKQRREKADAVVENDEERLLLPQILALHDLLIEKSKSSS